MDQDNSWSDASGIVVACYVERPSLGEDILLSWSFSGGSVQIFRSRERSGRQWRCCLKGIEWLEFV